jgi:hypothetical protein
VVLVEGGSGGPAERIPTGGPPVPPVRRKGGTGPHVSRNLAEDGLVGGDVDVRPRADRDEEEVEGPEPLVPDSMDPLLQSRIDRTVEDDRERGPIGESRGRARSGPKELRRVECQGKGRFGSRHDKERFAHMASEVRAGQAVQPQQRRLDRQRLVGGGSWTTRTPGRSDQAGHSQVGQPRQEGPTAEGSRSAHGRAPRSPIKANMRGRAVREGRQPPSRRSAKVDLDGDPIHSRLHVSDCCHVMILHEPLGLSSVRSVKIVRAGSRCEGGPPRHAKKGTEKSQFGIP